MTLHYIERAALIERALGQSAIRECTELMLNYHPDLLARSVRICENAVALADLAGVEPARLSMIARAAYLQNIGMLTVDRAVFMRRAPLSDAQKAQVLNHPRAGGFMLRERFGDGLAQIAFGHHERFYPGQGTLGCYPRSGCENYDRGRLQSRVDPLHVDIAAMAEMLDGLERKFHGFSDKARPIAQQILFGFRGDKRVIVAAMTYLNQKDA